jgi:hypothetical protein
MAEQGPNLAFQHLEVPIHSLGADTMLRPPFGLENQLTSPKSIEDFVKKVPSSTMTKQDPNTIFQHLEVPTHSLGANTILRPPLGLENQLTSSKTIEDFMKKSAQFD